MIIEYCHSLKGSGNSFHPIKFDIMLKNVCLPQLVISLCFYYHTGAIYVDMSRKGLAFVPDNISTDATILILNNNNIIRITNMSFILYKELSVLHIERNDLTYIEDGSFDHNSKLNEINAGANRIIQLPHSFGAAAPSVSTLQFWGALRDPAMAYINLTEMIRLKWLNIGYGIHFGKFDATLLPRSLEYICLNIGHLTQFPDFGRYTPQMTTILLATNSIAEIPSDFIAHNSALEELYLNNNELSTIPDLFHLPLTNLHLSNNPLACNQSLCWIRMWNWMEKSPLRTDDITCDSPNNLQYVSLMNINPVTLGCENGT